MKLRSFLSILITSAILFSCNGNGNNFDASGTFEADEVVVSSSANGKIIYFNVVEGSVLAKDSLVALVDPTGLNLQKEEVEATIRALGQQTLDVNPQIKLLSNQMTVQQSLLNSLLHEKNRIENLIKSDAATGKQLDDINAQIDVVNKQMAVTQQQINVQKNAVSTQNRGILSQQKPMEKRAAQVADMLDKTKIKNPIQGTVITKYAEAGEITTMGKPMYKIADISNLNLRAYVTGVQLPKIKLGQTVKVMIDDGAKKYKEYSGTITWVSDKAEFTPKTIQTKDERANLVYAIKVKVKNDGYLKIGMYGEVKL
ncbi:MAG TPA: HlyD family efflux transporter periplasmic adaptor subunit [Chitinophagaceae bacterium]|nr:HlyD family efflux transporter periplasmic adaptor subunit [Chitinophagaceae bacterium]